MITIIKDPGELTSTGVSFFADALKTGNYEITTSPTTPEYTPQRLSPTLQSIQKIRTIMEDPLAEQYFFSIRYQCPEQGTVIVPIGVYGVSHQYRVRFPLVINGIWITLVSLGREAFINGLGLGGNENQARYFSRFVDWKKDFIRKSFAYFFDTEYCAGMSWVARGPNSNTRIIAEEVGFKRFEFNNTVIFSKTDLNVNQKMCHYYKNCLFRWKVLSKNDANEPPHINDNTVQLGCDIVGLVRERTIPET